MSACKEVAKFIAGAEAFHAAAHIYLWLSNETIVIFGVTATPQISMISALVNAAIACGLVLYGWDLLKKKK